MHIDFAAGEAGYHEARALFRLMRYLHEHEPAAHDERQLIDTLSAACKAHCAAPAFADLNARLGPLADELADFGSPPGLWRGLFGPSRREVLLSKQRIAALERAERAERSSFEALAETARVARERDEVIKRIAELEARLGGAPGSS